MNILDTLKQAKASIEDMQVYLACILHDTHAIERKKARVIEYMTYAEQCGTLTPNA